MLRVVEDAGGASRRGVRSRRACPRWLYSPKALGGCCITLTLIGCAPPPPRAGVDAAIDATAGVAPARVDPGPLDGAPGLREASWNIAGVARSASLWAPEQAPRSLIVMLHGAILDVAGAPRMEPASISRRMLRCLAVPAFADLRPLVIAPQSDRGQWWKKEDTAFVLGLVAAARERWPELGPRSVITGYSNGGISAWYFARLYPDWFSAAIPMAFDFSVVGATRVPVYAIQGDKDELFAIDLVRAAIEREREQGGDVTLAVRHRAGHMTPCAYMPELREAGRWLEQHAFVAPAPPPASP